MNEQLDQPINWPSEETTVTPAMIDAGSRELALFSPGEDSLEEREAILEAIYLAMEQARLRPKRQHS